MHQALGNRASDLDSTVETLILEYAAQTSQMNLEIDAPINNNKESTPIIATAIDLAKRDAPQTMCISEFRVSSTVATFRGQDTEAFKDWADKFANAMHHVRREQDRL